MRSTAARLLDRRIRRLEHDGHCMATILPPTRVAKWHKWRLVPNVSNAMLPGVAGKNLKARRENHLVLPWVLFDLRCERDLQIAAMNHPNRDLLNADSSRKRQGVYPPQKKSEPQAKIATISGHRQPSAVKETLRARPVATLLSLPSMTGPKMTIDQQPNLGSLHVHKPLVTSHHV